MAGTGPQPAQRNGHRWG